MSLRSLKQAQISPVATDRDSRKIKSKAIRFHFCYPLSFEMKTFVRGRTFQCARMALRVKGFRQSASQVGGISAFLCVCVCVAAQVRVCTYLSPR